jgi:MYXO-CTERM domain-containing protein
VAKYVGSGNQRAYNLYVESQGTGSNDEPAFIISPDGTFGSAVVLTSDDPLPLDEWVHLVATYEPGTSMRIYRNGELDKELTSGVPGSIAGTTAPLWIGVQYDSGNSINYFDGLIDEVAVYNYALGEDRVRAHYAAATVPEPASAAMMLLLFGLLVPALRRRRRSG